MNLILLHDKLTYWLSFWIMFLDKQVVKEMVAGSRDVTTEDSLYETVKELKDPHVQPHPSNGTATQLSPEEAPPPAPLLNGHASPGTPERGPLCDRVEYASVDLNKKSRHSADMEAKRRSDQAAAPSREAPEELPPPVPEKVLDENDNQPVVTNGAGGAGIQNGEVRSLYFKWWWNRLYALKKSTQLAGGGGDKGENKDRNMCLTTSYYLPGSVAVPL